MSLQSKSWYNRVRMPFDAALSYLAKLMASSGSWTSSISRCCDTIDCIFMRLLLVACCSLTASTGNSSWLQSRDCTDSKKSVYKLFLSASALQHKMWVVLKKTQQLFEQKELKKRLHRPLEDRGDCSASLQSRFLRSCMDFPAMIICLRTGLRKDTIVSCLLLEP